MILFLETNGIHLEYTQQELADLGWGIADGKTKYEQILAWIIAHTPSEIKETKMTVAHAKAELLGLLNEADKDFRNKKIFTLSESKARLSSGPAHAVKAKILL